MSEINENTPLCFELIEGETSAEIILFKEGSPDDVNLSSSYDMINWTPFIPSSENNEGTKLILDSNNLSTYISGNNSSFSKDYENFYKFKINSGKVKSYGNLNSLINFSDSVTEECFHALFILCSNLVTPPSLPAKNLAIRCYKEMFLECTNLIETPELPATTLAEECYAMMFQNCISLKKSRQINALSSINFSFDSMFASCESLSSIEINFSSWDMTEDDNLFNTTAWIYGVSDNGIIICPDTLDTSIRDENHIPEGWTVIKKATTLDEAGTTFELKNGCDYVHCSKEETLTYILPDVQYRYGKENEIVLEVKFTADKQSTVIFKKNDGSIINQMKQSTFYKNYIYRFVCFYSIIENNWKIMPIKLN